MVPRNSLSSSLVKRENTSQSKAQEWFYLDPALNYPRDSVRVLMRQCTVVISQNVTWQRVTPAQMNEPLSMEEEGSEAYDVSTSDRGGGGVVVEELDDGLVHSNDLDVTWRLDLNLLLLKYAQQVPATGEGGDGTAVAMGSV